MAEPDAAALVATGNDPCVTWLPPTSHFKEPTNVQVTMPDYGPGRYATPDGWLDVSADEAHAGARGDES